MVHYGEVHPSTCNTIVNMATVNRDLENYDTAIELYQKSLEVREKLEGKQSLNYATN